MCKFDRIEQLTFDLENAFAACIIFVSCVDARKYQNSNILVVLGQLIDYPVTKDRPLAYKL